MAILVDPRGEVSEAAEITSLAPRPATLDGKVVSLMDNGKWNTGPLLDKLEEHIRRRYDVKEILRFRTHFSRPAKPELIEELVERSDVVVNGSGD